MNVATSAEVRAWAVKSGLRDADADKRGRLSQAEVEAFNAKHKAKSYEPGVKPARVLAVKVGRKTVKVDALELRAGINAGKRGRIDTAKAAEYVIGKGLA